MEVIKKFVNEVEREYSSIKIGYKFDADESEYEIWYYCMKYFIKKRYTIHILII